MTGHGRPTGRFKMLKNADNALGEGLVYHGDLPITWRSLDAPPDEPSLFKLNEENAELLRQLIALDEYINPAVDTSTELLQAINRLDVKMSLVLDLVGQVLARQLNVPDPNPVAFSERGIHWTERQTGPLADLIPGQPVLIGLYLRPEVPKPLRLPAQIKAVAPLEGRVRLVAGFAGMADEVRDGLAKLIFRNHRRSIANRRGG